MSQLVDKASSEDLSGADRAFNIPKLTPRYGMFLIQVKRLEAESSR